MTTVLLIDDEPDTLAVYAMLLELAGYRVLKALDGAQALQALAATVPDIIVTDWMMPGINGKALCEQLRQAGQCVRDNPDHRLERGHGSSRRRRRALRRVPSQASPHRRAGHGDGTGAFQAQQSPWMMSWQTGRERIPRADQLSAPERTGSKVCLCQSRRAASLLDESRADVLATPRPGGGARGAATHQGCRSPGHKSTRRRYPPP